MADAAWKKLKDNKSDCEIVKKRDAGDTMHKLLEGNELTVQRLSSAISGKAQNDATSGPREFVPFTEDERTIESFKRCCESHFAAQIGTSLVCDILAGEQGPSCKTLEQIPDMKVIYVRFVTGNVQDCVPEWRINKSDLEMVLSHSHTLTRLEGPTHPPKGAKGSGTSSSSSKFFCKFSLKLPSRPVSAPRSCRKDPALLREHRKPERYRFGFALQNASHDNV